MARAGINKKAAAADLLDMAGDHGKPVRSGTTVIVQLSDLLLRDTLAALDSSPVLVIE